MRFLIPTLIIGSVTLLLALAMSNQDPASMEPKPSESQPQGLITKQVTPVVGKSPRSTPSATHLSPPPDLTQKPYSTEAIEYYEAKITNFCQTHDFPNFAYASNPLNWMNLNANAPSGGIAAEAAWSPRLSSRPEVLRSIASTIDRHHFYDATRPGVINLATTVDDQETWEDLKGMLAESKATTENAAPKDSPDNKPSAPGVRATFNLGLLRNPDFQAALQRKTALSWQQHKATSQERKINPNLPELFINSNGILARFEFPLKPTLTRPQQQGSRGTCGAFAISSALDIAFYVKYGRLNQTSVQSTFFLAKTLRVPEPEYSDDGITMNPFFWGPDSNTFQPFDWNIPQTPTWPYNPAWFRPQTEDCNPVFQVCNVDFSRDCLGYRGHCEPVAPHGSILKGERESSFERSLIFKSFKINSPTPGISPAEPADFVPLEGNKDLFYLRNNGFVDLMAAQPTLEDALLSATYYLRSSRPAPVVLSVGLTEAFIQAAYPNVNDPFPGFTPTQPFYTKNSEHQISGWHAFVLVGFVKTSELQQARLPLPESRDKIGYFIALNSWGETHGDGGFDYLPYNYVALHASELYAITNIKANNLNLEPNPSMQFPSVKLSPLSERLLVSSQEPSNQNLPTRCFFMTQADEPWSVGNGTFETNVKFKVIHTLPQTLPPGTNFTIRSDLYPDATARDPIHWKGKGGIRGFIFTGPSNQEAWLALRPKVLSPEFMIKIQGPWNKKADFLPTRLSIRPNNQESINCIQFPSPSRQ